MGVWKFKYQRRNDIGDALSREEVKYDCNRFLVAYRRLIAARYEPVFGDETRANSNHSRNHLWQILIFKTFH